MAVNRAYTLENGEKREEVTFVDVVLWARLAEIAGEYLKKGRPVFIEGRLQLDTWDDKQSGQKRFKLRVIGETMQLLGSRPSGGGGEGGDEDRGSRSRPAAPLKAAAARLRPTTTRSRFRAVLRAARSSRVLVMSSRHRELFTRLPSARRRNQHSRRVRHRESVCSRVSVSGERRLPACRSQQPAETPAAVVDLVDTIVKTVAGKLPATAGWQPALPKTEGRALTGESLSGAPDVINRHLFHGLHRSLHCAQHAADHRAGALAQTAPGFETPERVLAAKRMELREIEGIGNEVADQISSWEDIVDLPAELRRVKEFGATVLTQQSPLYPRALQAKFTRHRLFFMSGAKFRSAISMRLLSSVRAKRLTTAANRPRNWPIKSLMRD